MDGVARLVWKLARNHTWGTPIDADTLVRLAATDEDHDEMRQYLEDLLELPFVSRGADGVYIPTVRMRTLQQRTGFERTPTAKAS